MQAEQKQLMHQQMVQQNSIKKEEFVKLRVKATALRKELTQLQGQKQKDAAGEDKEEADSASSHDHHNEDAKGDKPAEESEEDEEVDLDAIDLEDPNEQQEQEMKPLTP